MIPYRASEPLSPHRWPASLLRRGMLVLFAVVVLTGLGLSWFIARNGHAVIAASSPLLQRNVPLLEQISGLKAAVARQQLLLNQYYALTLDRSTFLALYASNQNDVRRGLAAVGSAVSGSAVKEVEENNRRMRAAGDELVAVMSREDVDWDMARSKLNELARYSSATEGALDQLSLAAQHDVLAGGDLTQSRVAMMIKLVTIYSTLIMLAAVLVAEYIRLRYRAELELAHQATHDMLTGLGNRRKFEQEIATLGDARRTVALIGVDRFQPLASGLGHVATDSLLQALSVRLRDMFAAEQSAELFHFDPQTFVALLPITEPAHATAALAQRLDDIVQTPFRPGQHDVFLSLCVGLSRYPEDGADPTTLLRHADLARRSGCKDSSRVTHYRSTDDDDASLRLTLEADLHRAVERRQFVLHYQPQVDARGGMLIGAEALIRWCRPEGLVSPLDFIPLAEDTGLIVPIGEWVLFTACREAVRLQQPEGPPVIVAVNVSTRQFRHPQFVDRVAAALSASGLAPGLLELEVTESIMMGDGDLALARLLQLKELGVRIAVDDFGTGYSSLAYLRHLPLDRLKIDQAFVRSLPRSDGDGAIAKAIIKLGHSLDLQVLAEGVENDAQQHWLVRHRCDALQGHLFSQPVPLGHFLAWQTGRVVAAAPLSMAG